MRKTTLDRASTPAVSWNKIRPREHIVQIYGTDEVFLDSLTGFVAGGLAAGDAVIIIATADHRAQLETRLSALGCDLQAASGRDAYFALDAEETLARFFVNDWPNDDLFTALVADLLARARRDGRRVRAFGEMVAILWEQGRKGATVRLEYLWHQLCEKERFALFCAYPKNSFANEGRAALHGIFAAHSKVIPG